MSKKPYITPSATEILKDAPHHNYYSVMEFRTEQELNLSNDSTKLINTKNHYYRNGMKAMKDLLYAPNPNTKLASGETMEELKQDMIKKINEK